MSIYATSRVNQFPLYLLLTFTALFGGCGFTTDSPVAGRVQTPSSPKIQLKLEVTNTSYYAGRMDTYHLLKQRFESKHPNVEVVFVKSSHTPSRGHEPIDLVEVGTDMLLEQADRLVDLTPFLERDSILLSDFYESVLEQKRVDDRVMALPSYPEPLAVFYSKKWFDHANISYPQGDWTWEQHAEIAAALTRIAPELGGQFGTSIPFDINWIETLVLSRGGSLLSPDGSTAKGYLDSPKTIEAVEWLAKLIENKVTAPYTEQWNNGYGYAADLPASAGMSVGYYYKLPEYLLEMGEDLGVAPLPRFANGVYANVMFSWGHGIRADSLYPELAWELLRDMHLTDEQVVQAWAKTDLPTRQSTIETNPQHQDPLRVVFINEFQRSVFPTTLRNRRWSGGDLKLNLINPELRRIISSAIDLPTEMAALAEKIDATLAEQ